MVLDIIRAGIEMFGDIWHNTLIEITLKPQQIKQR